MLRYYTYYSIGGYKDLYLGSSKDPYDATWYFPLLPLMEEEAKGNPDKESEVEALKSLPAIHQLSSSNYYDLPKSTRVMFSHAGYKILFREVMEGGYALAIRNITSMQKDDIGRSTPFLIVITGETSDDREALSYLTAYMTSHIEVAESYLANIITLDMEKNGYKFALQHFNEWINEIIRNYPDTFVLTSACKVSVSQRLPFVVLPEGVTREIFKKEQSIEGNSFVSVNLSNIVSNAAPAQLHKDMELVVKENERPKYSNAKFLRSIAGLILYWIGYGLKTIGTWLIKLSVRICQNN